METNYHNRIFDVGNRKPATNENVRFTVARTGAARIRLVFDRLASMLTPRHLANPRKIIDPLPCRRRNGCPDHLPRSW